MSRIIALVALVASLLVFGWWMWGRGSLAFLAVKIKGAIAPAKTSLVLGEMGGKDDQSGDAPESTAFQQQNDREYLVLKEASAAAGDGDLIKAQQMLRELLAKPADVKHLPVIKSLLGEVNLTLILQPGESPGKSTYVVQPGDAISKIAAKTGAPAELIVRANNLQGTTIRNGDTLHIPILNIAIVIYLQHSVLQIFDGDDFLKEYPIRGFKLPPGAKFPLETQVLEKISLQDGVRVAFGDPAYFNATRTITTRASGFNIHATDNDGKNAKVQGGTGFSLDPTDLEEIFLLVKNGTPVQILAQ